MEAEEAKRVEAQNYRKHSSTSYPTFEEAKQAFDLLSVEEPMRRKRLRKREAGVFEVVIYKQLEAKKS